MKKRRTISESEYELVLRKRGKFVDKKERVMVIGDIHEPFCLDGYFEHCVEVSKKYKTTKTVFIGDILDNHYSSFHETDPDGLSAGDELGRAVAKLKKWHDAFPDSTVVLGNHDYIVLRKLFHSGVSSAWIKRYQDVLQVPSWSFVHDIDINGVHYTHGTGTSGQNAAYTRAVNRNQSVVTGHIHTQASIRFQATQDSLIFGMQVGCGVDEAAYAMAYGKNFPKRMIISCAVVLDGHIPIIEPQVFN
jgi:predicted phosphodiesterase